MIKSELRLKAFSLNNNKKQFKTLTLIVRNGLYSSTEKNTAMESMWRGNGINSICTNFSIGIKPVIAVFCE